MNANFGEAMGTWGSRGDNIDGLCVSDNLLWWYDGKKLMAGDTGSPRRFVRDPCDPEQIRYQTAFPDIILQLLPAANGAVFAHTQGTVWLCRLEGDEIRKDDYNKPLDSTHCSGLRLHEGHLQVCLPQNTEWVTLLTETPISAYAVAANSNGWISAWVVSPGADHELCFQNLEILFLSL